MPSLDAWSAAFEWLRLTTLTTSIALVAILSLRHWVRTHFGSRLAYALWWALPIVLLASFIPGMREVQPMIPVPASVGTIAIVEASNATMASRVPTTAVFVAVWLIGALLMLLWQAWQQRRFMRGLGQLEPVQTRAWRAKSRAGLPAVAGLLRPRILLPADFEQRYSEREQQLMLAHERAHIRHGDLHANALFALVRSVYWFNPLVHMAAGRFRHDQELACDQRVVAGQPQARRDYAEAMLKTLVAAQPVPLGCHWGITHPMKERLMMLKQSRPSRATRVLGLTLTTLVLALAGVAAWSAQPKRAAMTTPSAAQDFRLDVSLSLNAGKPDTFQLGEKFGQEFALASSGENGGASVRGEVRPVLHEGRLAFLVDLKMRAMGMDSTPTMLVSAGKTGTIETGKDGPNGFEGVKLTMTVVPRDVDAARAAARPWTRPILPVPQPPAPPASAVLPAPSPVPPVHASLGALPVVNVYGVDPAERPQVERELAIALRDGEANPSRQKVLSADELASIERDAQEAAKAVEEASRQAVTAARASVASEVEARQVATDAARQAEIAASQAMRDGQLAQRAAEEARAEAERAIAARTAALRRASYPETLVVDRVVRAGRASNGGHCDIAVVTKSGKAYCVDKN